MVTLDETLRKGKERSKECKNERLSKDDLPVKTWRMSAAVGISFTDSTM